MSFFKKIFGVHGIKYPNYVPEKDAAQFPTISGSSADYVAGSLLVSGEKCPKCGTLNSEDSRYCGHCGNSLPEKIRCECGKYNSLENNFCNACGSQLKKV